ncbi:MAG: polymorphic toxin-type HINT domain-containing protein [Candidatus Saccharimonadales bacterium]
MKTSPEFISIDSIVAASVLRTDAGTARLDRRGRKPIANSAKALAIAMITLLVALVDPVAAEDPVVIEFPSNEPPADGKPVLNPEGFLIGWVTKDPLGNTWLTPRVPSGVMTSPPEKVTVYEGGGVFGRGELLIGKLDDPEKVEDNVSQIDEANSELGFYQDWLYETHEQIREREKILEDPDEGQATKETAQRQLADLYAQRDYVEDRINEEEELLSRKEDRESPEQGEKIDEEQADPLGPFFDASGEKMGDLPPTDDAGYTALTKVDEKKEHAIENMEYAVHDQFPVDAQEINAEEADAEEAELSREEIIERIFAELYGQEGLRYWNAMKAQGGKLIIEDLWDLWGWVRPYYDVWRESVDGDYKVHVSIDESLSNLEAAQKLFELLMTHAELWNYGLQDIDADDLKRLQQRVVKLGGQLVSAAFHLGYGSLAGFGGTFAFVINDIEKGQVGLGTIASLLPYLPKGIQVLKIIGKNGKVLFKISGCFVAGTKVLTDNGFKNIENIQVGDYVWSRDEQTGEYGYKRVTRLFRGHTDRLVHLTYAQLQGPSAGRTESHDFGRKTAAEERDVEVLDSYSDTDTQTLVSTLEHPYWVQGRGWVQAADIRFGERLFGSKGEALIVVDHEIRQQEADHYNFEVEGWHTYFVAEREGGVAAWVHNDCWLDLWREAYARITAYQDDIVARGLITKKELIEHHTVARVVVNGKEHFGVNSGLATLLGETDDLARAWVDELKRTGYLPPTKKFGAGDQWWTHAEAQAVFKAVDAARASGQTLPKNLVVFGNRRFCPFCVPGNVGNGFGIFGSLKGYLKEYLDIDLDFQYLDDTPWPADGF